MHVDVRLVIQVRDNRAGRSKFPSGRHRFAAALPNRRRSVSLTLPMNTCRSSRSRAWGVWVEILKRRECRVTKSAFVDSNSGRFEPHTAGTSVCFRPDAPTVEIHHGRALDLSFICHQPSENGSYSAASLGRARSRKVAYAFAADVRIIPVPAQLVHRILLPDDRSFTFPVPWHFLQDCARVIRFSWTIHDR
jgi:hypothetical protein